MPAEIRWLALLPDPVTGLDAPVKAIDGRPMIWVAVDRVKATRQVKAALSAAAFRLCAVVSVVDWEARQQTPQRRKVADTARPDPLGWHPHESNPRRVCYRCGGPTGGGGDAKYCAGCRRHGPRRKNAKPLVPVPLTSHKDHTHGR